MADTYSPWTPQQTLTFSSTGGYSFTCLAGDGAPTITDGFAQINVVARPRQKAYTQPAGYNPIVMTIPIRFEAAIVPSSPSTNAVAVERDIQILEGMAGRGKFVSSNQSVHTAEGDPPIVQVYGVSAKSPSNLIPKNLHGLSWVISGLEYDQNPVRNHTGNRRRQDVTVTLTEWVRPPATTSSTTKTVYSVYRTDVSLNTVAKIVRFHTSARTAAKYRKVVSFSRDHGAKYKSYNQHLKLGTAVYVPIDL